MTDADAVALTIKWLERAVIGLNLCPFAKSVHVKGQIHYAVTHVSTHADVLDALKFELNGLQAQASIARDTTLLIVPDGLRDFLQHTIRERMMGEAHGAMWQFVDAADAVRATEHLKAAVVTGRPVKGDHHAGHVGAGAEPPTAFGP